MVAGSRTEGAGGFGERGICPVPGGASWTWLWSHPLSMPRAGVWTALTALYALAVAALLLPWPFGAHPDWAYNWEGYTAWRWTIFWEPPGGPSVEIWAPTDGLMTDSGQGPLVGLPVAIGTALAGFGLAAMRVPVALLAATAVPLLWLLARRVAGPGPATLAALLLAISPVFLLYGRTATLVGVSLLPLLLTALALAGVLDAAAGAGWCWRREGFLVASMLLGIYAYAPVRLAWPLTIALLGIAAWREAARRRVLLQTALACAFVVPLATMALEHVAAPDPDPMGAAVGYFHARGEQLLAMSADPAMAGEYVRDPDAAGTSGWEPALRLVVQNAADLAKLLLDRDTGPAPVDYWNERGRFWPWFCLPFATVGAIAGRRLGLRGQGGASVRLLPLVFFLGLALPLLLTSRVHIGRLVPALPFALLLAATGLWVAASWLTMLARSIGADEAASWIAPFLAGALLLPAAVLARVEMDARLTPTRVSLSAAALAGWSEEVRERGGAVLVEDPALGADIERVRAATYRLELDDVYRFVDLNEGLVGRGSGIDPRPALFWRGALGALHAGELPRPCRRFWFVSPEIAGEFFDAWRAAGCEGAPDSVVLP